MAPKLLSSEEIATALRSTSGWSRNDKQIEKNYELKDFDAALAFVNAIGAEANAMDHHPDILLHGWNKVRITISTHSAGGLTQNDFDLAKKIDALPSAAK